MPVRPEIEAAVRRAAERMVADILALLDEAGAVGEEPSAGPRPRVRRRAQSLERLASEVLVALARRDGVSIGAIARDVGAKARELTRPLTWLLARGQVRRTGERRGARYFLVRAAPARGNKKRPLRGSHRAEADLGGADARRRAVPERRDQRERRATTERRPVLERRPAPERRATSKDTARPSPARRARQPQRKGGRAPRRKR
jgi:hypothetical protein